MNYLYRPATMNSSASFVTKLKATAFAFVLLLFSSLQRANGFSSSNLIHTIASKNHPLTSSKSTSSLHMAWYSPALKKKYRDSSWHIDHIKHPNGSIRYAEEETPTFEYSFLSLGSDWPSTPSLKRSQQRLNRDGTSTGVAKTSTGEGLIKMIVRIAVKICYMLLGPLRFCRMLISLRGR